MVPKEIIDSAASLLERFNNWRQLKKDINAVLRLLYLESMRNVNLLACLNLDNNKNIKPDDDAFIKAAMAIETDMLELIFLEGKKSSRLFKAIEDMRDEELEDEDTNTHDINNRHTMNALGFIYIKVWTIKKLASLNSGGKAIKTIRYRARLKNILTAYNVVLRNLRDMDEIRPLLNRNTPG